MDRLIECDEPSIQSRFTAKIKSLEADRAVLLEQASAAPAGRTYDESLRTAMLFLANPWNLWKNGTLKDRHMTLEPTFPQGLLYTKNQGLRTAQTPKLFELFRDLGAPNVLAERVGFEPTVGLHPRQFSRLLP